MVKVNSKLAQILLPEAIKLCAEQPDAALSIIRELIPSHCEGLIWMIEKHMFHSDFIELIATDPQIFYWNGENEKLYQTLASYCKPSKEFETLLKYETNFCNAAFCSAMLKTKTIRDAARLFSNTGTYVSKIPQEFKIQLINHIKTLQEIEKNTIWIAIDSTVWRKKNIEMMIHLGMDPLWIHPQTQYSFLFTKEIWHADTLNLETLGFDLNHRDIRGNNALEHHCLKQNDSAILYLSQKGLKLSDRFPNVERCRKVFPDNFILQTFLGACLIKPRKSVLKELTKDIPKDLYQTFNDALKSHPDLHYIADKIDNNFTLEPCADYKNWTSRFYPQDIDPLKAIKKCEYISIIASVWKTHVPSSAVKLIPESPAASLVASAILEQSCPTHTQKPLPPWK